jgi:hypothetical protein
MIAAHKSGIDWLAIFQSVVGRGSESLHWRLPEPWVHAELFAALNRTSEKSGWVPFSIEVPYATYYPVSIPGKGHPNWRNTGAVKYADLCIHSETMHAWCWFEFKVRHAGQGNRLHKASLEAMDAFRKDIVSLLGFDVAKTADNWQKPDKYTIAYWFDTDLKPHISKLKTERHIFATAFLQLGGKLRADVWQDQILRDQVQKWVIQRQSTSGHSTMWSASDLSINHLSLTGEHDLIICEWTSDDN